MAAQLARLAAIARSRVLPAHSCTAAAAARSISTTATMLAGHSKWAKIHRAKGANDAAMAAVRNKMSVAIAAAAKAGGPDPESNLRLATLVQKAKEMSVPKDVVERAINKSRDAGNDVEEVTLEGLGPGGVAIIVETLTNSKKRTTMGVRAIFTRQGCDIGSTVSFLFESRGKIVVPCAAGDEAAQERVLELATGAEAQDVEFSDDGTAIVWTEPTKTHAVKTALAAAGVAANSVELVKVPNTFVDLPEESEEEAKFGAFLEALEDHEDVHVVWHNAR